MQLFSVEGNRQWLDGGAMFGNCPRELWTRWVQPDARNRIELACRGLLVRERDGRIVLFEAGVGAFFEPKLRERFGIQEPGHELLESLAARGVSPESVDVVVLSHLHFDHAGGVLAAWSEGREPELVFPRAQYVVSEEGWQRARSPHPRDKASFIAQLPDLLEATGRLERVSESRSEVLGEGYSFRFSNGHTPGLMLTRIEASEPGPVTFASDLIPGVPWLHVPITMGYDRYPELLVDEKRSLLSELAETGESIFLVHDPAVAVSRVRRDERGRFEARDPSPVLEPTGVASGEGRSI